MDQAPRKASVRAVTEDVVVWMLSREDFESRLGSMKQLQAEAYLSDPRKLLADFYAPGDSTGPFGALAAGGSPRQGKTQWFAVYRPTSRDSIAKMLGKVGLGKGLNIKGKSAKKNRLSGFVPFCQISKNEHKADIEDSPPQARTHIYYRNKVSRTHALAELE